MKAVIFNSGLGNRMGDFTRDHHKSMAPLKDGETIFHRQIRLLSEEGITRTFRIKLAAATHTVIGNGLDLLGIRRTEEI